MEKKGGEKGKQHNDVSSFKSKITLNRQEIKSALCSIHWWQFMRGHKALEFCQGFKIRAKEMRPNLISINVAV